MKVLIVVAPHFDQLARNTADELSSHGHSVQIAWPTTSLRHPPWDEQHDVIIAMPWHSLLWLSQHFSHGAGVAYLADDVLPGEMEHFGWAMQRADMLATPGGRGWLELLQELANG